jgi:hypothetical protein
MTTVRRGQIKPSQPHRRVDGWGQVKPSSPSRTSGCLGPLQAVTPGPTQADRATRWDLDSLAVGVSPDFAVTMKGGEVMVVKLWLREAELSRDGIMAMQWLMTQHMPMLHPQGVAAVVDLRRRRIHRASKRPLKRGYELALRSEAESMGALWRGLTQLAASELTRKLQHVAIAPWCHGW